MIKRFYILVVIQLILFALTVFLLMWSIYQPHLFITMINLAVISILEIVYLIYFISVTNRDLTRFFEAFQFQDTTLSFVRKKGEKAFLPLYQNFDRILNEYRRLRNIQEKDRLFFLNILSHVTIGVVVSNNNGQIIFSNQTFRRFNNGREIRHLDVLDKLKPGLAGVLQKMRTGQRELIRVINDNEVIMLLIRCSEYKQDDEKFRILSFQDINYEIEEHEIEAWQKLIRILTHEITNSVSPITLTSSGIINLLEKDGHPKESKDIDDIVIDNALLGLHAIRKRSKGLAKFVESYRSMTQIPDPTFSQFKVLDLFQSIESLKQDDLQSRKIQLKLSIRPQSLQLSADEKLIEQVLINLINNAIQALKGKEPGIINLDAWQSDRVVNISVTDNGIGIAPENLENIFIPFFTTKSEGSGIGLSLSRQIMRIHSGNITVQSIPDVETRFILKF